MTQVWTCHRCGTVARGDDLDGNHDPIGDERESWCSVLVFCDPCGNKVIEMLVGFRVTK